MPKSKTEVGLQALQALRAVEGDATPDSNDTTVIEEAYDQIYAMLQTRHLAPWAPTEDVPDEAIIPMVNLVAAARLTFFKPPLDVQQMILAGASTAVEDLTEVFSLDYVYEEIQSEPL